LAVDWLNSSPKAYLQNGNNDNIQNLATELKLQSSSKRELLFQQISNEVMYQYGPAISHYISNNHCADPLASLTRIGAIRIIFCMR
jgi:hypothetical protein